MMSNGYFKAGATKMLNIDFTFIFPSTKYFVSANMLIEFSAQQ